MYIVVIFSISPSLSLPLSLPLPICRLVAEWYRCQLDYARYAQVPIGNLGHDLAVFVADIMYARLLKKNHFLLWMSDSCRPDLGGSEEDDQSFGNSFVHLLVLLSLGFLF